MRKSPTIYRNQKGEYLVYKQEIGAHNNYDGGKLAWGFFKEFVN
jgi:hypothetical protein